MLKRRDHRHSSLVSAGVLVTGSLWGLFWIPLRAWEAQGIPADWVSVLFFAVSIATILPWALKRDMLAAQDAGRLVTGFLLGLAFALYTLSLGATEVVRAILLFYLTPVWSTLAGTLFWGEKPTGRQSLALAFGLCGLWLVLRNEHGLPLPSFAGDWMALLSGLLWSLGTLRSYHSPPQPVATAVLAFSAGGFLAASAILLWRYWFNGSPADPAAIAGQLPWIVGLGFCMFALPTIFLLWAAQRLKPARIGILLLTEVLTGTVSAALLSQEAFGAAQMLGAALIVAAGALEVTDRH